MTTPPTTGPARSNTTTTASERPGLIGDPPRLAEPTRAATRCPDLGLKASVRFARSPMPFQKEQSVARQAEDVRLALTAHGLELVLIPADLEVGGTEVESIDQSGARSPGHRDRGVRTRTGHASEPPPREPSDMKTPPTISLAPSVTATPDKGGLIGSPACRAEGERNVTRRVDLDRNAAVGYARSATTVQGEGVDRQIDGIRRTAAARRLELV